MGRKTILALALAVLVLAVYARAAGFEFVAYDDPPYVTKNEVVQRGLTAGGLAWVLTHEHGGNWHPLTGLSHMLDCELFGLRPAGHHATSVLLHAANALLLFGWLASATRAVGRSALVAALFALHPLRVESVAWISERKDVLSTFFGLLALWSWTAWTRRGGAWRYLGALLALALGLMAKPMLVTLPFVMLLLDVWPLERRALPLKQRLVEKLPFFLLSAASCAVTYLVQRSAGAVHSDAVRFPLRLVNALVSYVRYLGQTFWPSDLSVFYPHPYGYGGAPWSVWALGAGALLLAGITLVARRRPYALVGWLWYLGTLVPVIGLVQVGSQAMADRYTYVPSIGIAIAIVWGAAELVESVARRSSERAVRAAASAAAGLALVLLAARAWVQLGTWRTSTALFAHAVAIAPSPITLTNLGNALHAEGRTDEALIEYMKAIELAPTHAPAYYNIGTVLLERGDTELAIARFRQALALDPDYAEARRNLGVALRRGERNEEAIAEFERAVATDPLDANGHYNLGVARIAAGDPERGIASLEEALRLSPGHVLAHVDLGNALQGRGELDGAIGHYHRAIEVDPGNASAHYNLGVALGAKGDSAGALAAYERAVAAEPGYALAHYNLGNVLSAAGRTREAIEHYEAAVRGDPGFGDAYENLAAALATAGRLDDAVAAARTALGLATGERAERVRASLAHYEEARAGSSH